VVGFARYLSKRWEKAFEDKRRESGPAYSNYASSIGSPCLRQLFYQRVGAEREPFSARTLAIFESGNMLERDTLNFLRAEMEIDVIRSQEAAPKTDLNIGCRIDGGVRGIRQHNQPYLVIEVKRINRNEWNKITDCDVQGIHDMLNRCSFWVQKYPFQGSAYIHLYNEAGVIFALREPSSGWCKFVPMIKDSPIDLELWRKIQTRAKYINACVEANDCPEPIPYSQVCKMCDYRETVCHPERQHEGVEVLTHPDILQAAEEFLELRDMARAFAEKKAYLRELILATKRDHIMLGDVAEVIVRGDKTKTVTIKRPKGGALFFGDEDYDD
jgi:hypothetical protein